MIYSHPPLYVRYVLFCLFFVFFPGNSAFGSQLLDKTKFVKTGYALSLDAVRLKMNSPQFRSMKCLDTDVYEVCSAYKKISIDLPVYIGLNVLLEAKLHMLKYVYSFLAFFVPGSCLNHLVMDTDSLYTAYSGVSLEATIKTHRPDKHAEFMSRLKDHCTHQGQERHPEGYLPRTCCGDCERDDQKHPLLFKVSACIQSKKPMENSYILILL